MMLSDTSPSYLEKKGALRIYNGNDDENAIKKIFDMNYRKWRNKRLGRLFQDSSSAGGGAFSVGAVNQAYWIFVRRQ